MATIAALALARPTFDVPLAETIAVKAYQALDTIGHTIVGPRHLLMDGDATEAAIRDISDHAVDLMLILQVSFTDASMTVEIARRIDAPAVIWAFPEARTGGRLRLNSFCGLNLAAHALGRAEIDCATLYGPPDLADLNSALEAVLTGHQAQTNPHQAPPEPTADDQVKAGTAFAAINGSSIGLVGEHPVGFDTCRYDASELDRLASVTVDPIALETVFDRARAADAGSVMQTRLATANTLAGLDAVDQDQLDRSFRVHDALQSLAADRDLAGIAVRCWPEMFTDYGCAACGPMAMMNEAKVPCACEADVYGTLTALILQALSNEPALLVDIVDMNDETDTGVFWHCGLAPVSMASDKTPPRADLHSNRKMPLLNAFALKPGRITLARLSQAKNQTKLVIGGAEMVDAPMSFSGTSGVVRFDSPVAEVRDRLLGEALEHHVVFTYGDHRGALVALADRLGLPVLTLS